MTATTTMTRAWDLRVGDVLAPVGLTVQRVTVDAPGRAGRLVHVTHDLGRFTLPVGALVTVQGVRATALWD